MITVKSLNDFSLGDVVILRHKDGSHFQVSLIVDTKHQHSVELKEKGIKGHSVYYNVTEVEGNLAIDGIFAENYYTIVNQTKNEKFETCITELIEIT